jgi:hypothetical protein
MYVPSFPGTFNVILVFSLSTDSCSHVNECLNLKCSVEQGNGPKPPLGDLEQP